MDTLVLFKELTVVSLGLAATYALIGVSVAVIFGTTRIFHFAHAVVYTVAAYVFVLLGRDLHLPWVLALLGAVIVAVLLGVGTERFVYRPMRKAEASTLTVFIASLGLSIAGPAVIQLIFGPNNQTYQPIPSSTVDLFGVDISYAAILSFVVCSVLTIAVLIYFHRGRLGVATQALRVNPSMASNVGISADRIHILVFAVGSALIAIAAVMFMFSGTATPNMGLDPVLIGFIAVFLGGQRTFGSAAIGGVILGLVTGFSGMWLKSDYQAVVVFVLLFVMLVIRPQGMSITFKKKALA